MTNYKVSVILTVLNEGEGISCLLDSLLKQSCPPDEIVVVDGGSRDQTLGVLNEFSSKDSRLKVFVEPGVNISRGRNIAIEKANGPIIAVTDGGCRPSMDWLKALVQPMREDSRFSAVAGVFTIDYKNSFEFFSGALCTPVDTGNADTRMFYGRNSAFKKDAWEAVHGYPEWLYTGEDTLFSKRFLHAGFKVAYAPDAVVSWRPRPTLRKLIKMFFLYGRGNGRIGNGNLKGSIYWLKYHILWLLFFLLGFASPWAWLIASGVFLYLYVQMIPPVLREIRQKTDLVSREFWVPVIVYTRNIATNIGYLFGQLELKLKPDFQKNLDQYCHHKDLQH